MHKFTIYNNDLNEFSEKNTLGLEGSVLGVYLLQFMNFAT